LSRLITTFIVVDESQAHRHASILRSKPDW
jgi:hypothetical protein